MAWIAYLKLFHIVLAVVAVGYNATYGLILSRASSAPRDVQKFALETVRGLDRVASWAYIGLFLSGGGMVTIMHYRWNALWTSGSALLLVVAIGLTHGLYTPTLKKQIAALESGGPDSEDYRRLAARGRPVSAALLIMALTIVALMVLKIGN